MRLLKQLYNNISSCTFFFIIVFFLLNQEVKGSEVVFDKTATISNEPGFSSFVSGWMTEDNFYEYIEKDEAKQLSIAA